MRDYANKFRCVFSKAAAKGMSGNCVRGADRLTGGGKDFKAAMFCLQGG